MNTLQAALEASGCVVVWWDMRRPLAELLLDHPPTPSAELVGIIVNKPGSGFLGTGVFKGKHWFAVKKIRRPEPKTGNGAWYLDSNNAAPSLLPDLAAVKRFLAVQTTHASSVILVVTRKPAPLGGQSVSVLGE